MNHDEEPIVGVYAHISNFFLWVFFWIFVIPVCVIFSVFITWSNKPDWWTRRWFTGGRPMQRIGHAFTDNVSGKEVDYYVDKFGRFWMAEGPWSLFRVKITKGRE